MSSFENLKPKFTANKGHLTRAITYFESLVLVPDPPADNVEKAYERVENRMDINFDLIDELYACIEGESSTSDDDSSVIGKYKLELDTYCDFLTKKRCELASKFSSFKKQSKIDDKSKIDSGMSKSVIPKPVRIQAIGPPIWNGKKSDFHTWKLKFQHIMQQASLNDDLTQLC